MTQKADRAREIRWRDQGNARLTMRMSRAANQQLDLIAGRNKCSRRDVIEGLLLGTIAASSDSVAKVMREQGLSAVEAREWVAP